MVWMYQVRPGFVSNSSCFRINSCEPWQKSGHLLIGSGLWGEPHVSPLIMFCHSWLSEQIHWDVKPWKKFRVMLQKDLSLAMKNVPNPGLPPTKKKCQSHGFKFQTCWTCYRRHLPTRNNFSTQLKMYSTRLYHIDQWDLTTGGPFPFVNIHLILLARGACASHARPNGLTPGSTSVRKLGAAHWQQPAWAIQTDRSSCPLVNSHSENHQF